MDPKPLVDSQPLYVDEAEIEAFRLIDLEGLYQEDAGRSMNVSRGTVWRLITSARRKIAQAMFEGRPLIIGHSGEESYEDYEEEPSES
jgi:predicted DNA-binding protein (UPF0251 family)